MGQPVVDPLPPAGGLAVDLRDKKKSSDLGEAFGRYHAQLCLRETKQIQAVCLDPLEVPCPSGSLPDG